MSSIEKINRDCPLWEKLTAEVNDTVRHEPDLEEFFAKSILNFSDIESSISYVLANQLQQNGFDLEKTQSIIYNAFISEKNAYEKIITDICLPILNSFSASLLKKIFSLAVYATESSISMFVPRKIDLKSTVTSRPLRYNILVSLIGVYDLSASNKSFTLS